MKHIPLFFHAIKINFSLSISQAQDEKAEQVEACIPDDIAAAFRVVRGGVLMQSLKK